jgi:glycosyltransferase involved in cell wall biosynthesis
MSYRIAYLTSFDPRDKSKSSGVYFYQSRALAQHVGTVQFLGPVNSVSITVIRKVINLLRRFLTKKYNNSHSIILSKIFGRIFTQKLKKGSYDLVFADKTSTEIAHLETNLPIIYSTDATFKQMVDYYPNYTNLSNMFLREGLLIEKNAITKAELVICASSWAASSVVNDFGYDSKNTHVLPRGANLDRIPDVEKIINKKKGNVCRLVFVGKEWERKGYDIAFKTMVYIRSKGIPVKLTAVGFTPPSKYLDNDVEVLDYINKNTEEGIKLFDEVMFNSDFYILPTRAECMGIAFCEAAAYGLPVITRNTGGVSEVVKDGISGFALPYDAEPGEYGEQIISIFNSDEQYYKLIRSSREYFEERLNWDVWAIQLKKILDGHFGAKHLK